MSKLQEISAAVEAGNSKAVHSLVQEALAGGCEATDILKAMTDAMSVVGDKFSAGEIYIPEMLISAKAMQKGVDVLRPVLAGDGSVSLGKCIIGTVKGDLHDIGKNLVAIMIESAGFEVIDLGVDIASDKFIEAIKANPDVKVVALSALLTTTMPAMEETVKEIKASGFETLKIIVGGAPITEEYAKKIGADAYAPDAGSAAVTVKSLI